MKLSSVAKLGSCVNSIVWAAALCAVLLASGPALAGKARDYLNAPVDTWVTFYNVGHSDRVAPGSPEFGIPNITTDITSQSVILTRIIDVGGRTGGLSVVLPHADIDVTAGPFAVGAKGMGDISFVFDVNLFGAPALSREDFKKWTPETYASFHLLASAPTGAYDSADLVNVGSNRWSLAPTINYSYTPDSGWTWLEGYATARFFGDNSDAPGAADRLEQRPIYQFEVHASRNLTPDLWLSADAYYDRGGEIVLDGVGQDDAADTWRLGAGLGLRLGSLGSLFLNYEATVSAPAGQPKGEALRLTFARVW